MQPSEPALNCLNWNKVPAFSVSFAADETFIACLTDTSTDLVLNELNVYTKFLRSDL